MVIVAGMGISVGSESSGGIKDVFIHDNVVGLCEQGHCLDTCCGWGPGIFAKCYTYLIEKST